MISRASQKTLSFAAKPKPLLANAVLEQFRAITQVKGEKAQGRKVEIIKSMMIKCQGSEAKFIIRALQGKLRIGIAQQTVLVALAHAFVDCPTQEVIMAMKEDSHADSSETVMDENDEEDTEVGAEKADMSATSTTAATNKASGSKPSDNTTTGKRLKKNTKRIIDDDDDFEDEEEAPKSSTISSIQSEECTKEVKESDAGPTSADMVVENKSEITTVSTTNKEEEEAEVVDVAELIANLQELPTTEAIQLKKLMYTHWKKTQRRGEAGKSSSSRSKAVSAASGPNPFDVLCGHAEFAVKRAFSECPNLSLLTSALLKYPIYR